MVVNQVQIAGIVSLKSKRDTPVRSHRYCPVTLQLSLQRVKPVTGDAHVTRALCLIQDGQDSADLVYEIRPDQPWLVFLVQLTQPLVPEAPDQRAAPA